MIIRLGTQVRLPVRLLDTNGTPVTGMLPTDISDGTIVGNATIVKGDSTLVGLALVDNANWIEIDATAAPGLYHVVVPQADTNVVGAMQIVILPAASSFLPTVITAQVDSQVFGDIDLVRKILTNKLQIFTSGGDAFRMVIYDDDGTTPLKKWDLKDALGIATTINPYARIPV